MKTALLLFLVSISAAAQAPKNVIVCNPADAERCKATIIEGRPMRELVHEGTSIAVGKPVATAEGDYRVFVRVSQVGPGPSVGLGDCRPDSPACARDECNVPVKPELVGTFTTRPRVHCLGHLSVSLRALFVTEIIICD